MQTSSSLTHFLLRLSNSARIIWDENSKASLSMLWRAGVWQVSGTGAVTPLAVVLAIIVIIHIHYSMTLIFCLLSCTVLLLSQKAKFCWSLPNSAYKFLCIFFHFCYFRFLPFFGLFSFYSTAALLSGCNLQLSVRSSVNIYKSIHFHSISCIFVFMNSFTPLTIDLLTAVNIFQPTRISTTASSHGNLLTHTRIVALTHAGAKSHSKEKTIVDDAACRPKSQKRDEVMERVCDGCFNRLCQEVLYFDLLRIMQHCVAY